MRLRLQRYCGRSAPFNLSQAFACTGPQKHSGQQLHRNKRLPPAPLLEGMLFEHATAGGHALLAGDEIRDRTAPYLSPLVLVGPLPRRKKGGIQDVAPSAGMLRPPC